MPEQNKLSRRGFLGVAAGTGIGVVSASALGGASPAHAAMGVAAPDTPLDAIGIQLYNLRSVIPQIGFKAVFEELARQGYEEVEFAGYGQGNVGPVTIPELRGMLDDTGLKAIGSHIGKSALIDPAQREQSFDIAEQLGMPYIGTANNFSGNTVDEIKAEAARFNDAGAAAVARGLKIYQHNHTGEFAPTSDDPSLRRIDVFKANTDPSLVFLEMDIFWAYEAAFEFPGFDPTDYVAAGPQRYPLFHVKDGTADPGGGYTFSEFGAGVLPFRHFFDVVGAKSVNHPIYEQDNAPNTPASRGGALGAAERSIRNMEFVRTLTWLDELRDMLDRFHDEDRLASHVHDSLQDRLQRATALAESGSESRTIGYLEKFVARANNQIKGDMDDTLVRSLVVNAANMVITWLHEADDRENAL
jgi:sugar phosphate isomerase/epimerase